MPCLPSFESAVRLWDSFQVELHGQYSIARFEALFKYEVRHTSKCRALAIALLTALPCLLLVICIDALPLVHPSEGYDRQNYAYWVRIAVIGWLMPYTLILQFGIVAPNLPMSTIRIWTISTVIGAGVCLLAHIFVVLVGFPLPFAIEFQSVPFLTSVAIAMWFSWKDAIRADPSTCELLKRYLFVLVTQVVMLETYIGFNVVFNQLHGYQQTVLCGLLPFMKLFFKNCVGWATFHVEDLSPTIVIFTIDLHHALFVSLTMQQASGTGANVLVMVVDVTQNYIAYLEISKVLRIIDTLVDEDKKATSLETRQR